MTIQSVMPNLFTDDVERAVSFYRDVLGGVQTFQSPSEGPARHVELRLGDAVIAVSSRAAVRDEGLPDPDTGHPMELVLWCASADDAVGAVRAAGQHVLIEPYSGHVSGLRRAYVADPDGNWIALVSSEKAADALPEDPHG